LHEKCKHKHDALVNNAII